jgi:ribosome recycling factor
MVEQVKKNSEDKMKKAIAALHSDYNTLRTGRASAALFDSIKVDYYGTPTPVNQLATLSVPEPSLLQVQPWDVSQIGNIEKAIRSSDLGLNPMNDGKIIRVPIPALTEERRKELARTLKRLNGMLTPLAQREQRLRQTGQATMFDLWGQTTPAPMPSLDLAPAEVSVKDRLAWEKELMGVYLSEHPFAPIARSSPRASAGLRILAASIAPSDLPAPTSV